VLVSSLFYARGDGFQLTPSFPSLPFPLIGLDINSTTNLPSQTQMFRLATNRKFVRAAKRVAEELNAVGLKTNSDVRTNLPLSPSILDAWAQCLMFFWFPLGRAAGDFELDAGIET
jgi:hypothetical protein